MTRTIDFNDPRFQRFTELAHQLAQLPQETRAAAIQQALERESLAAHDASERAAGATDESLLESIQSMTTDELKALADEAEASGLAATLREVIQASTPPEAPACNPRNAKGADK